MKLNKLLTTQIITSIHARRGRAVKLKSTRYRLAIDIWIKRNFNSFIRKQCIQDDSTRYRDFHNNESSRERFARLLHSIIIEHPTKSGKLNEIGKIFLDLNSMLLPPLFLVWLMMLSLFNLFKIMSLNWWEFFIVWPWN